MGWDRGKGPIEVSHRVALHGSKVMGYECTGVKCSGNSLYLLKLHAKVVCWFGGSLPPTGLRRALWVGFLPDTSPSHASESSVRSACPMTASSRRIVRRAPIFEITSRSTFMTSNAASHYGKAAAPPSASASNLASNLEPEPHGGRGRSWVRWPRPLVNSNSNSNKEQSRNSQVCDLRRSLRRSGLR